jgi:Meiotically up-regulated gene family
MTGQELWDTYQEIRKQNLGCGKCGSKHIGNGCVISSDYYTECGNRDKGVNRLISLNETDFETDFDDLGMTPAQNISNGMLFAFTVETPVKNITDTDGNSTTIAATYTNSTISWNTTIETTEPADEAKAVTIETPTLLAMPELANS